MKFNSSVLTLAFSLTILISITVGLIHLKGNSVYSFTNNLKLVPQKQNLTELYFNNHQSLPNKVNLGQSISFSFTIHNLENLEKDYPYKIHLNSEFNEQVIEQGVVRVHNGAYKTLIQSIPVNYPIKTGQIIVELPGQNQRIHFLISTTI